MAHRLRQTSLIFPPGGNPIGVPTVKVDLFWGRKKILVLSQISYFSAQNPPRLAQKQQHKQKQQQQQQQQTKQQTIAKPFQNLSVVILMRSERGRNEIQIKFEIRLWNINS